MIGKIMDDYDKRIIRDAMLEAQSEWLDFADTAEHPTQRGIGIVVADAFGREAEKYKTKETNFHDHGPALNTHGGSRSAWDDEHGVAPALPETGETV